MITNSIFVTHIRYGILCWGRADKTYVKQIEILLNKAIRCINFYKRGEDRTTELYYKDKLLKFKDIFNLELAKFMFKFTNGTLPECFSQYFTPTSTIHTHNTRNVINKLFIPRMNKKQGHQTISFLGSLCWNSIPDEIKKAKYIKSFTKKYKSNLLKLYENK